MNLLKELQDNQTVLMLMPGMDYKNTILETAKALNGKKICYITLNRTFDSLKELFKKHGIKTENTTFIDLITTLITKPAQTRNVHFLNPHQAAETFAFIASQLKNNYEYIIFDSITNLFSYRDIEDVEQYIFIIINKIRQTRTVIYALDEQETRIPRCCMYVDKTVRCTKK
ncbi:hypothetical protein HY489_05835 [Candidatus Woesearchaeota archaeon]|nr:hypothetical protein [Candidatus Woesearchaeota archaeon]